MTEKNHKLYPFVHLVEDWLPLEPATVCRRCYGVWVGHPPSPTALWAGAPHGELGLTERNPGTPAPKPARPLNGTDASGWGGI